MVKYIKGNRRLSIISDIIIFVLLSIAAFLILNIFKEIIVASNFEENSLASISYNKEDSLETENLEYVNRIKDDFFISVKYGNSQKDLAERLDATVQNNNYIINNNLKTLYVALNKYSKKMFENFEKEGYKLNIVILDKFNNDNLALASRNKLNQFTLYISNTERLERAFHHEMCHILEYYLENKGISFESWDSLNPADFSYLNSTTGITSENVYYFSKYSLANSDDTYFATKYSKVNAKEDRAEVFAEVMISSSRIDYIEDKTPLYYKYIMLFNTFKINIPYAEFTNYYEVAF